MKKALKIVLGIFTSLLAIIVIAVAIFACTNYELAKGAFDLLLSAPGNNLKAAWIFITTDSEGLDQKINDNNAKYNEAINNVLGDLSEEGISINDEVMEALNSGEYTEEEMTRIITSGGAELETIKKEKAEAAEKNEAETDASSDKPDTEVESETDATEEKTDTPADSATTDKTEEKPDDKPADKTDVKTEDKPSDKTDDKTDSKTEKPTQKPDGKDEPAKTDAPADSGKTETKAPDEDYDEYYPDGYQEPVTEQEQAPEADKQTPTDTEKDPPATEKTETPQTPEKTETPETPKTPDTTVTPEEPQTPQTPQTPAQPKPVTSDDTAATIAKLYVVKSRFLTELTALEGTIRSAYEALPKDQQVPASRKAIAGQYISVVANLEVQCDAEVETILAELTTKLQQQGKDTSVVATLRNAYENEKSLKKAYYMDVYMNGI